MTQVDHKSNCLAPPHPHPLMGRTVNGCWFCSQTKQRRLAGHSLSCTWSGQPQCWTPKPEPVQRQEIGNGPLLLGQVAPVCCGMLETSVLSCPGLPVFFIDIQRLISSLQIFWSLLLFDWCQLRAARDLLDAPTAHFCSQPSLVS